MEMVLARPCCLWLDLGVADYEAEALSQAVGIFGVNGIVIMLSTGTPDEQGDIIAKEQKLMQSLALASCARVWLQVDGAPGGVGVHADGNQKQTGSLMIFAGNIDGDRNPLAKRVSRSIILIRS